MLELTYGKGDTVIFTTLEGTYEGRIVRAYSNGYIKIRYRLYGFIPVYRIDRIGRMLAHDRA